MSIQHEALKIKVVMKADSTGPLPIFVATCPEPEIRVTGQTLTELRQNLERAIAEALTEQAGEGGEVGSRPLLLEFAA
jgi:hypothetical protein